MKRRRPRLLWFVSPAVYSAHLWKYEPALRRLRFYYPDEYRRQAVGALKEKIRKFESREKNQK